MSKKPIIRWTIGDVSDYGFLCLEKSVELMKRLLGSKCNYAICHNNLNENQLKKLPNVDILINSKFYLNIYPVNVPKEKKYNNSSMFWKLYPARIRKECHEIIIDNDILIYKLPEKIIKFLNSNHVILTESHTRSYSGILKEIIPYGFNINSGIIGLPPNYDFENDIKETIKNHKIKWEDHTSEQTLVAYILSKKNCEIINKKEIYINFDCHKEKIILGTCGVHMCGLNGTNKNEKWYKFIKNINLFF
jgi:hypothetical protein